MIGSHTKKISIDFTKRPPKITVKKVKTYSETEVKDLIRLAMTQGEINRYILNNPDNNQKITTVDEFWNKHKK